MDLEGAHADLPRNDLLDRRLPPQLKIIIPSSGLLRGLGCFLISTFGEYLSVSSSSVKLSEKLDDGIDR